MLFHGDRVPTGPYWLALLQLAPHVLHVQRARPRRVFGHRIRRVEHSADVARLRILIGQGLGRLAACYSLLATSYSAWLLATFLAASYCAWPLATLPGCQLLRGRMHVNTNSAKRV